MHEKNIFSLMKFYVYISVTIFFIFYEYVEHKFCLYIQIYVYKK